MQQPASSRNARIEFDPEAAMARYLQKISLRPYTDTEIWTGWELEGRSGEIEGLILADNMSEDELAKLGVTEFHKIPAEYIESGEFNPKRTLS
jgi:hypothetical protein